MRNCPHTSGMYGCSALINNGFGKNSLYIPENWWERYCVSGHYHQCPNLKVAVEMKQDLHPTRSKGAHIKEAGKNGSEKVVQFNVRKKVGTKNPVHSHGGLAPHYCEKPWREPELRFRVVNSSFYTKPWRA